ncbi:MAG: hypothetical protein QXT64_06415 [Desulfurococcaceae archaeon]
MIPGFPRFSQLLSLSTKNYEFSVINSLIRKNLGNLGCVTHAQPLNPPDAGSQGSKNKHGNPGIINTLRGSM